MFYKYWLEAMSIEYWLLCVEISISWLLLGHAFLSGGGT